MGPQSSGPLDTCTSRPTHWGNGPWVHLNGGPGHLDESAPAPTHSPIKASPQPHPITHATAQQRRTLRPHMHPDPSFQEKGNPSLHLGCSQPDQGHGHARQEWVRTRPTRAEPSKDQAESRPSRRAKLTRSKEARADPGHPGPTQAPHICIPRWFRGCEKILTVLSNRTLGKVLPYSGGTPP